MVRARIEKLAVSKALALGLLLAALMALSLMLAATPAHAATTFTVNDTGDFFDHNVGDGVCDFTISEGNRCSLRAAIQEANHPNNPGPDIIRFDIGGSGVKTIRPSAELPAIKEQVTIDGYTQPGSKKNTQKVSTDAVPLIELDGSNAGSGSDGLKISAGASNSEIRGLVINRFLHGIVISAGALDPEITGVKIEGNFIGTDATGQAARGNGFGGVMLIDLASNSVKDNTIGGTEPEARNLISGNGGGFGDGVAMIDVANNKVEGNLIGTKQDGTSPLGNTGEGVSIFASSGNSVGGALPGTANTIAFNNRRGVAVERFSPGNRILGNSIFSNESLGIDLIGNQEADGRTANDPGDTDAGPNNLQNFPEIESAKPTKKKKKKTTTITGTLNSTLDTAFTVQFFSNPSDDPGEGKRFIGSRSVSTNGEGNASFSIRVARGKAPVGSTITATATDPEGNTSEFSAPKEVVRR